MTNNLFIVCPFSSVELRLKRKYSNAFFISCPGAIIPYSDNSFIEILKGEIIRNNIKSVYFVNDTSSRIINAVLSTKDLFGLDAEYLVEKIYNNAFPQRLKGCSIQYQQLRLAEFIVQNQKDEFLTNGVFTDLVIDEKIMVKTLVVSPSMNFFKESRIAFPAILTYEL
jgi:hypothetical protein